MRRKQGKGLRTRWLDDQVKRTEAEGGNVRQGYLRHGRPDEGIITVAEEIVSLAKEIGAGLTVIGSGGLGGTRRALIGCVSDSVVRYAHWPVLIVRRRQSGLEQDLYRTVLLFLEDLVAVRCLIK